MASYGLVMTETIAAPAHETVWSVTNAVVPACCLQLIAEIGVADRAGDFFTDPVPRADCYLLMEIIHDWSDAEADRILRALRRASSPGATVLILERIRDEEVDDTRAATLDVIMLAVTGGRERTADELGHLLRHAGFRPTALLETAGAMRVLEAIAV